jgi:TetR/AcrR family transcriptional regulator
MARTPQTKKRDAAATRDSLLAAATHEFAARGFAGARVDDIAARAKANKRMLYAYFGDKDGLYREVLRQHFARVLELGAMALEPAVDLRAQAEAIIRRYFWFLAENPDFVRLVGWETLDDAKRATPILLETAGAGLEALHDIVRRGIAAGVLRPGLDPGHVTHAVNALCLGFFQHQYLLERLWQDDLSSHAARERSLDNLVAFVFDGVGLGA